MATFLVIGLGRFGSSLALKLMELGNEVMAIDQNEETVSRIAPYVTQAKIADCMDESVLRTIGVENYDACFVCTSEHFQSSMEITSMVKELGASMVVSKADSDIHTRLLKKIGADEVVFPQLDMAQRTAMRFSVNGALEYIELSEGYAIFELQVPAKWVGKSLAELDIRNRYNVNIIGIKVDGTVTPITTGGYIFKEGEHIMIAGENDKVMKITE